MNNRKYAKYYSESGFWNKLSAFAVNAGRPLIINALKLYYAMALGIAETRDVLIII